MSLICVPHTDLSAESDRVGTQEIPDDRHWIYLWIYLWISSAPYQSLINALSSVSNGWIQTLGDPSDVRNLSQKINRMASQDMRGKSHKAWGKASGWCPRVETVRNLTPSMWRETAQSPPISILSPTVTTKISQEADSEPFVHKAQESLPLLQLGRTTARDVAGVPEHGPWPRGLLVSHSPSHYRSPLLFWLEQNKTKSRVPDPRALFFLGLKSQECT